MWLTASVSACWDGSPFDAEAADESAAIVGVVGEVVSRYRSSQARCRMIRDRRIGVGEAVFTGWPGGWQCESDELRQVIGRGWSGGRCRAGEQLLVAFGGAGVRVSCAQSPPILRRERPHVGGGGSFWRDLIGRGRATAHEIDTCHTVLELLGIDDVTNQPIESLSLGKGRLVEVGRALMTQPKLLLLDEPSSGLDRDETDQLSATLRAVQEEQGFAMLLVEHDVELVREFNQRSDVLDSGMMIAQGDTRTAMEDAAVRAA